MGGYIALDDRCGRRRSGSRKLALLDTSARPIRRSRPSAASADRARARPAGFAEVADLLLPIFVHRDRQGDDGAASASCATMAEETGAEAFVRQQQAIMTRPDVAAVLGRRSDVRRWCWSATATS